MYPHVFPPHWIKRTWRIFTPSTILRDWRKIELGRVGDLVTWNGWGKGHMGEGGHVLVGEDTPKDTMLVEQASFYI